ncbi:MAG TPA: FAD-binding oxidoreductase [Pseudonocardiaceae bacterium]|nr:FAD-binding oxidoreductase [Pseudonocardiaceae bacterium]
MTTASPGATVTRPTTVDEAAKALRESSGTVLFRGSGTKMNWGGRVERPDLILETGDLNRLRTHNPADMTAAVEAGMPLATLQGHLAESGQWLALDPPSEAAGATLGGLLTTGDSGPRRLRYGALRDLVIGVTLVLADGTVGRAGGQVIKNVAGYDLSKLVYGALGTLGLIAEVVLRVHPRPEASATTLVPASGDTATRTTLDLLASPLEPSAVDWIGDPGAGAGRLAVRFEGTRAGVEAQTAVLRGMLAEAGAEARTVVEADENGLWQEFAAACTAEPGQSTAFAGTLPSRLPMVADALAQAADASGARAQLVSHSALGLHVARFTGPPADQARAFDTWRRDVLALGGTVLLRDRPAEVDGAVDALGPPPTTTGLLRALRSRLDPKGRCAPGRLGSWL